MLLMVFLLFHLGTPTFFPPEWILEHEYYAYSATVWSLGILLFSLVCGTMPFNSEREIVDGTLNFKPGLSKGEKIQKHYIKILQKPEHLRKIILKLQTNSKPQFVNCEY